MNRLGAKRFKADILHSKVGRLRYAVLLATLCTLTVYVGLSYQIPDVALAAYIIFFAHKNNRTASVVYSLAFAILITIVIGALFIIVPAIINVPSYRLMAMVFFSFSLMFLTSASKLRPIAPIIALIMVYSLDVVSRLPVGELVTRSLLYAWLLVGLPAALTIVLNIVFGSDPRSLVELRISDHLQNLAVKLVAPSYVDNTEEKSFWKTDENEIPSLIRLSKLERLYSKKTYLALSHAYSSTLALSVLVDDIYKNPRVPTDWKHMAAHRLANMSDIFFKKSYPIEIMAVDISLDRQIDTGTLALLTSFNDILINFTDETPLSETQKDSSKEPFISRDALSNKAHFYFAAKTTLAAAICYLTYSLLDWPGIHTCLITCYIVALLTIGETVEKAFLRIAGCMVGGITAMATIVWLIPSLDRIGGLLGIIFLISLLSGWIAGGSQRTSYIGYQLAFAFFLAVIQGSVPADDLSVARDRILGILIGNTVMYLIFVWVLPASISRRIDQRIRYLRRTLVELNQTGNILTRLKLRIRIKKECELIKEDMIIAAYEPSSVRPSKRWIKSTSIVLQTMHKAATTHSPSPSNTEFKP